LAAVNNCTANASSKASAAVIRLDARPLTRIAHPLSGGRTIHALSHA
jgi:hypothetical protein